MAERVLVVEEAGPVADALVAQLAQAGFACDVAAEAQALAAHRPEHALAVVRAERRDLAVALKVKDQTLPVLALFADDDALVADPSAAAAADGVLVGPLLGPAVAAAARAASRLGAQQRRILQLERTAGPIRESLDLFRRLVLMEVKRARRYRYPLSLALVAVDGWKDLAPPLGPAGRAKLLADVLRVLARGLRNVDLPVLHADEKFLVLMPHTPPEGAMLVARRLCERVAEAPGPPRVTASAGVACFEGKEAVSLGSLLKEANRGLDRARAQGGARAERGSTGRPERKVDFGW